MENILKIYWTGISEDARRQFIDANSAFTAWEAARKTTTEVKGSIFWKHQDGGEYLIRTALDNSLLSGSSLPHPLNMRQVLTEFRSLP